MNRRLLSAATIVIPVLILTVSSCKKKETVETTVLPQITYSIVNAFPHDTTAFTEGLLIYDGKLYESTGEKESWIGTVDVGTGKTDRKVQLDTKYFGEGMAILNNKVYYLTWKHKTGFIYDLKTFSKLGEFNYDTEGWGMTTDNTSLIMSAGTDKIYFLDSATLKPTKVLSVTRNGEPQNEINELEYIDGFIFANIWRTSEIVKIDANSGEIVGVLDLSPLTTLVRQSKPGVDVLNGIAWHPKTRLLLATGKFWPNIYVLRLKE